MATTVLEVMNRELFSVREHDRADDTLATLIAMRISAAPVVDARGRPIGMISWRDLVPEGAETVGPRMSRVVEVVRDTDRLQLAAATLVAAQVHHAPVIDRDGALCGFVSALDLLSGVTGQPAQHPPLFPHFDEVTGVAWTNDQILSEAHLDEAPTGPGVIAYIEGGRGRAERVVMAEATHAIRSRLLDRLSEPLNDVGVRRALDEGRLRWRAAAVEDGRRREQVLQTLLRAVRTSGWFERLPHTI